MSIVSRVVQSSGTSTTDATAEQWHIKSGKTAYIASGKVTGNAYTPAMMQLNGSSYWTGSRTTSGSVETVLCRFKIPSFTGGGTVNLFEIAGPTHTRLGGVIRSSDHATAAERSKLILFSGNSSGTTIMRLTSLSVVADNLVHGLFIAFSGSSGAAVFKIDGVDADDTGATGRVAPTSGTMDSGGASLFGVGCNRSGSNPMTGQIGYFGQRDAYLTNWSDFMQTDGSPKELDESTWTEWGAQPLFWNEHGQLDNNLGSAGAMTRNGTIVVGKGGNT